MFMTSVSVAHCDNTINREPAWHIESSDINKISVIIRQVHKKYMTFYMNELTILF